jgi:hypothetical protein
VSRLSRELRAALEAHRRPGWFHEPRKGLRLVTQLDGEVQTWISEREDGAQVMQRRASGEAALEVELNELEVAAAVSHPSLPRVLWTLRTGDDELTVGWAWRPARELPTPVDLRWLLRGFVAVGQAVQALHQAGWVHGDLKPEALCWHGEKAEDVLVWDLRIAQRPGPRRFEAFSARTAAPEQVTGGEVDPRTDVYALGVSLYSMFIRGRFPTILAPSSGGAPANGATLSAITCLGQEDGGADPGSASTGVAGDVQATLGAKVLFAAELERVIRRNTDIAVASDLLRLVEKATAQKREDRFRDAGDFAAVVGGLLAQAERGSRG